jgi:hypothetical protein
MMKELGKDDGPLGMYKKFTQAKENKELVDLLIEAVADEVFLYGGKNWGDFIQVMLQVNNAQSWAPLQALTSGGDPQKAQIRGMLLALQQNKERLKVPEIVIGFKVKETKKVEDQIKRLEKLAGAAMENAPPPIKGKVKLERVKIGDTSFLSLQTEGNVIPWDDVNLKDFEEKKDEFEELIKQAKKTTLAVSLGVKNGYLLLGITSSVKDLEKIGKGKALASREEFSVLARHDKKPLTEISYTSKEYINTVSGGQVDPAALAKMLKDLVAKADPIKDERKKAIDKDIDRIAAEIKKKAGAHEVGARVAFAFLTSTGIEGYSYAFGNHDAFKGVATKLPRHFGGDPIFAAAIGFQVTGENYQTLVKWIKIGYGHAEGVFYDNAPEEAQQVYKKVAAAINPIWKRLDEITTKQFLPSIKESGLGLVIDAKWSSKQWHK